MDWLRGVVAGVDLDGEKEYQHAKEYASLAEHVSYHEELLAQGSVGHLMHILTTSSNDLAREQAALALANLARTQGTRHRITQDESLPTLIKALREGKPVVQAHTARILRYLAADSNTARRMAELGLPQYLVALAQEPHLDGQYQAIGALSSMADNGGDLAKVLIVRAGAMRVLRATLSTQMEDINAQALMCIDKLVESVHCREPMAEEGVLDCVTPFCSHKVSHLRQSAMSILLKLSSDEASRWQVSSSPDAKLILSSDITSGDERLQLDALKIISALASSWDTHEFITTTGCMQILVGVVRSSDNPELLFFATSIVASLCSNPASHPILLKHGLLHPLISLFKLKAGSIQSEAARALSFLAEESSTRPELVAEGCVKYFMELTNSPNEIDKATAARALAIFTSEPHAVVGRSRSRSASGSGSGSAGASGGAGSMGSLRQGSQHGVLFSLLAMLRSEGGSTPPQSIHAVADMITDEESAAAAVNENALGILINVLCMSDELKFVWSACRALSYIATLKQFRHLLIHEGVLEGVIRILGFEDIEIRRGACRIVAGLAGLSHEECIRIESCIRPLFLLAQSPDIQTSIQSLSALNSLCQSADLCKRYVWTKEAVAPLITILKNALATNNVDLQRQGVALLMHMTGKSQLMDPIVEWGGIDLLFQIACMDNPTLVYCAISAFANMACSGIIGKRLVEAGTLKLLYPLARANSSVRHEAVRALANLGVSACSSLTALPKRRCFFAAAFARGALWLFHGKRDHVKKAKCLRHTYRYTVATDTWRKFTHPDSPPGRFGHTATYSEEFIYILGGKGGILSIAVGKGDNVFRFDLENNAWKSLAHGPARYFHSTVVVRDKLLVFGGKDLDNNRCTDDLYMYDIVLDKWCHLNPSPRPSPRYKHSAVNVNDTMIVFGGMDSHGNVLNDVWVFANNSWVKLDPASESPPPRLGHAAVVLGDVMVIFGGRESTSGPSSPKKSSYLNDLWQYDIATNTWMRLDHVRLPIPPRYRPASFLEENQLLIFGGVGQREDGTIGPFTDMWQLNLSTVRPFSKFEVVFNANFERLLRLLSFIDNGESLFQSSHYVTAKELVEKAVASGYTVELVDSFYQPGEMDFVMATNTAHLNLIVEMVAFVYEVYRSEDYHVLEDNIGAKLEWFCECYDGFRFQHCALHVQYIFQWWLPQLIEVLARLSLAYEPFNLAAGFHRTSNPNFVHYFRESSIIAVTLLAAGYIHPGPNHVITRLESEWSKNVREATIIRRKRSMEQRPQRSRNRSASLTKIEDIQEKFRLRAAFQPSIKIINDLRRGQEAEILASANQGLTEYDEFLDLGKATLRRINGVEDDEEDAQPLSPVTPDRKRKSSYRKVVRKFVPTFLEKKLTPAGKKKISKETQNSFRNYFMFDRNMSAMYNLLKTSGKIASTVAPLLEAMSTEVLASLLFLERGTGGAEEETAFGFREVSVLERFKESNDMFGGTEGPVAMMLEEADLLFIFDGLAGTLERLLAPVLNLFNLIFFVNNNWPDAEVEGDTLNTVSRYFAIRECLLLNHVVRVVRSMMPALNEYTIQSVWVKAQEVSEELVDLLSVMAWRGASVTEVRGWLYQLDRVERTAISMVVEWRNMENTVL